MEQETFSAWLEITIIGSIQRFPLSHDRICSIGRRAEMNTIVLDDDHASRSHAIVQRLPSGAFCITDLDSSNGTFVNGARITSPRVLSNGNLVTIGSHELVFMQETVVTPQEPAIELDATLVEFNNLLISVLVFDIRDYTGLARRVDADVLSQITGTLFRESGRLLQESGSWAQKYIGDALMGVWLHKLGEPALDQVLSVINALRTIVDLVDDLQSRFNLTAPIRIGCAVNTGFASVGNVGSIASADYTAVGDTVNMAFRLESATRMTGSDILIGATTFDFFTKVFDAATLFSRYNIQLKGYDDPVTAWGIDFSSLGALLKAPRVQTCDENT